MFVVGGHGYVGSRVVALAAGEGASVEVVSRDGDRRSGVPSVAWRDFPQRLTRHTDPVSIVWLLDGARHSERDRLGELLGFTPPDVHLVLVSTCTVYGDQQGRLCAEDTDLALVTGHAKLKAECEGLVASKLTSWCVQRFGALYGIDTRGTRRDRVQKWVTEAASTGVVTVPDPTHWRGWLHREQGARALWRSARDRVHGVFNVATANLRFGDAAGYAADLFNARVQTDGSVDLCDYQVDAGRARTIGLLDELQGEDLESTTRAFGAGYPGAGLHKTS